MLGCKWIILLLLALLICKLATTKRYNLLKVHKIFKIWRDARLGRGSVLHSVLFFPTNGTQPFHWLMRKCSTTKYRLVEILFETGITTNHTLTFSNGSENSSSFTSLGYFNQQNSKIVI
jgi:hypothetical protein